MSGKKLSSDEVPQKFIEWLLALGCPGDKVPSSEKIERMCKGQYYMTWRSMMEHVEAKDVINHKRLTVFCDDVRQSQEKKLLSERSSLLPEHLSKWQEHTEGEVLVAEAEARVAQARAELNELMDKVASKVIRRNSSRKQIADLQRRSWLLSQVENDLACKIKSLEETRTIADSLCHIENEQHDIESKLDRCITLLQRKNRPNALPLSTPIASSSIVSNHENDVPSHENDEDVQSLVSCRGDVLWPRLCEKLSSLYSALSAAYTKHAAVGRNSCHKRSMLAYTAALQSTLGLEVTKNRVHFRRTRKQLAASIEDLYSYVDKDAFELLAVRVQRTYSEARVKALKATLEELTARKGIFECEDDPSSAAVDPQSTLERVASVNKCIVKSREELERLLSSCANTERKIYSIRECLLAVFTALHNNTDIMDTALSRGVQLDFPTDSIPLLRVFYKRRCDRALNVSNLSFNIDTSEREVPDNPTFVDELNVYFKKFNLEKNRKLLLDSGETIWVFETLQALSSRLCSGWVSNEVASLLCPSVRASRALQRLRDAREHAAAMRARRPDQRASGDTSQVTIADITAITSFEADAVDQTKKRITENLILLEKVHRNLEVCEENLQFWEHHELRKYISSGRTIGGQTYGQFEKAFMERLKWNL